MKVTPAMIMTAFALCLLVGLAGRIAGGDYRARLEAGPDDEVGWLERQLNQMAAQLEEAG